MNLVNDVENDLALAFLVDKKYSDEIDSKSVVALMDKVREVLQPLDDEEEALNERVLIVGKTDKALAH